MRYKEIETIILVDDTKSVYTDGGNSAISREHRYKVLLSVLKKELKKVKKACLILGDGIFELDLKGTEVEFPECPTEDFEFPDGEDGDMLAAKIERLSGGTGTLLLIDYMLNGSKRKEDIGKKLCCNVLKKLGTDNIIKMPYTREDLGREERVLTAGGHNYTLLSCFPISAPTDAARYIMRRLEESNV